MDVLYYWKKMESDLKKGLIGRFSSDREKLEAFKAGYPDFIWIFKTPAGGLGDVELLAKLAWRDAAPKGFSAPSGESNIYYDVGYPRSGRFDPGASEANIKKTSAWMREHFPAAVRANFVGTNGQQELRGEPLRQLQMMSSSWAMAPLVQADTSAPV